MAFPRQVPNVPARSSYHQLAMDVVYDEVDGVPLRYDHYRPLGTGEPAPCVIVVHGGGWHAGDPSQAAGNALHFARRGVATVSVSYRLAPSHRFPAPLDDVRHGIRHVRAHADDLGIDPDRLALLGLSAGAHLALLAHLVRDVPELRPELPAELAGVAEDVRCIVAHYGPYYLARRKAVGDWDPVGDLLGEHAEEPAWLRLASPVHHAAAAAVPIQLVHGTGDEIVSYRESVRMHEALLAAGKECELLLLEGAPHAFQMEWRGDANRRANAAMDAFLERYLLG
jgi:acetyl esterase/lipase